MFVWFNFSWSYFSSCLDFLFLSNHLGREALRKPASCRWDAPTSMRDKKQNAPLWCSVFVWSISIVYQDYSAPMQSPMYFNAWCKMAIHYSPHFFSPHVFSVYDQTSVFPSDRFITTIFPSVNLYSTHPGCSQTGMGKRKFIAQCFLSCDRVDGLLQNSGLPAMDVPPNSSSWKSSKELLKNTCFLSQGSSR